MSFRTIRATIFAKTYPELSTRYYETVCTAAIRLDDGHPVRLYPVPLRYLSDDAQYKLWDTIEVRVDRNARDQRPESWKIDPATIRHIDHVSVDSYEWANRRTLIDRSTEWHYPGLADLRAAQKRDRISIGLVTPGSIEGVELAAKPADARRDFERKCTELKRRKLSDLFDPRFRSLDFLPNEIFLHWRCATPCATCSRQAHRMKVLDWGLMQLARRNDWRAAVRRLEDISNLKTHDFRLFLGNFAKFPTSFGIIALWYPKRQKQIALL